MKNIRNILIAALLIITGNLSAQTCASDTDPLTHALFTNIEGEEFPANKPITVSPTKMLCFAAVDGDKKLAQRGLKAAGNVDEKDPQGDTPLHFAVFNGHGKIVTLFIQKNANVNMANEKLQTALHIAAYKKNPAMIKLLLKQKAIHPNKLDNKDLAPLHIAIANKDTASVTALASNKKVDVELPIRTTTPLFFALETNKNIVAAIAKRANTNQKNSNGSTALHLAVEKEDLGLVKALFKNKKTKVDERTALNLTALHTATMKGKLEILKI